MKQIVTIQEKTDKGLIAGCDKTACEGCKGSFFCTSKKSSFTVTNPDGIPLEEGDKAVIELPPGKTLFSVFMSLGLPLIMFIPGYIVGTLISGSQTVHLIASLAGVALGFMISALFFRRRKDEYSPVVIAKEENRN